VGVIIFLMQPFYGGTQTGWTFYSPLAIQTGAGADAFAFGVAVIIISSTIGAVNILTTVITMRAPGLKWTRLPMTVWGITATTVLSWTATSSVIAGLVLVLLDRGFGTNFYLNVQPSAANPAIQGGGNNYLWEQLWWFFGHPEVYILVLPGIGVLFDIVTTFSRKPLYTYALSVLGISGVTLVSFLVWAHHLFNSGWEMELRGYYMGTTELISIPTGFVFLGMLGTLWRGNLWMRVPLAWVLSFIFTFVIGGLTGIYLSDVPADIELHGNYFVTGHFHYTVLGAGLFGFFAGAYYWFPKMTGRFLDEKLGWIHFWGVQIFFNLTFFMFFYLGLQGMPRRVADYSAIFQLGSTLASIFAFALGAFMLVFFANVVWSWKWGEKAPANPWGAKTLEWATATPVPIENFEKIPVVTSGPYDYGLGSASQAAGAATSAAGR
jgi:cytochrome c oxidase subunit 1